MRSQLGAALVFGLMLLTLVMLSGLAGVGSARIELLLAQNESFRENAASAASAGIEMAISEIVGSSNPEAIDMLVTGHLPGSAGTFEARVRFAGFERTLPQAPGAGLAGAHFEIESTGRSARHTVDRQRAGVLLVVATVGMAADCEPAAPRHCHAAGSLERLFWQRVPIE